MILPTTTENKDNLVVQKSTLAKLMAMENLTVEHQKISTAKFDTKNRILYLPIWKDMNGVMYDLLCGHEVGHALHTPAEGWHDAVTMKSKGNNYKFFLNAIEDARIEKRIQRKYPGLKRSFTKAYSDLIARDFFGTAKKDINKMAFIDRVNLFAKSQFTNNKILFSLEEQLLVTKVQNLETWADVIRVTDEIYAYSKNEQMEIMSDLSDQGEMYSDGEDDGDGEDAGDGEDDGAGEDDGEGGDGEDDGDEADGTNANKNGKYDDKNNTGKGFFNDANGYNDKYYEDITDDFSPVCQTDEHYRNHESALVDESSRIPFYVEMPKAFLEKIITPAKQVHKSMSFYFAQNLQNPHSLIVNPTKLLYQFKLKNEKYVNLLVKEFEMRKAANAYSKTKLSNTGDLDIGKLPSYKLDDNIFRKIMLVPRGKSHGMILLLDKSGSMNSNMSGSIEQILVLAMFCRKVNIPFIVYGFGDSERAYAIDNPDRNEDEFFILPKCFEEKENNLAIGFVSLREYISSRMPATEFNLAMCNMVTLKHCYDTGITIPPSEHLGYTPLLEALVSCAPIMKKFKIENKLDLTSLVIVHDGDNDPVDGVFKNVTDLDGSNNRTISVNLNKYSAYSGYNTILRDKEIKFEMKIPDVNDNRCFAHAINEWFKKRTGSKIVGFYLIPNQKSKRVIHFYQKDFGHNVYKESLAKFKNEKFLSVNKDGYNSFFLVSGGNNLISVEEEIVVSGKVTPGKLKNAFMRHRSQKSTSRLLVSKFVQEIATPNIAA